VAPELSCQPPPDLDGGGEVLLEAHAVEPHEPDERGTVGHVHGPHAPALRNTYISNRRAAAARPQSAAIELESLEVAGHRGGSADPALAVETGEVYAAIAMLPDDFRDAVI